MRRGKCPAHVSKSNALPLSHEVWTFGNGKTTKYIVKVFIGIFPGIFPAIFSGIFPGIFPAIFSGIFPGVFPSKIQFQEVLHWKMR